MSSFDLFRRRPRVLVEPNLPTTVPQPQARPVDLFFQTNARRPRLNVAVDFEGLSETAKAFVEFTRLEKNKEKKELSADLLARQLLNEDALSFEMALESGDPDSIMEVALRPDAPLPGGAGLPSGRTAEQEAARRSIVEATKDSPQDNPVLQSEFLALHGALAADEMELALDALLPQVSEYEAGLRDDGTFGTPKLTINQAISRVYQEAKERFSFLKADGQRSTDARLAFFSKMRSVSRNFILQARKDQSEAFPRAYGQAFHRNFSATSLAAAKALTSDSTEADREGRRAELAKLVLTMVDEQARKPGLSTERITELLSGSMQTTLNGILLNAREDPLVGEDIEELVDLWGEMELAGSKVSTQKWFQDEVENPYRARAMAANSYGGGSGGQQVAPLDGVRAEQMAGFSRRLHEAFNTYSGPALQAAIQEIRSGVREHVLSAAFGGRRPLPPHLREPMAQAFEASFEAQVQGFMSRRFPDQQLVAEGIIQSALDNDSIEPAYAELNLALGKGLLQPGGDRHTAILEFLQQKERAQQFAGPGSVVDATRVSIDESVRNWREITGPGQGVPDSVSRPIRDQTEKDRFQWERAYAAEVNRFTSAFRRENNRDPTVAEVQGQMWEWHEEQGKALLAPHQQMLANFEKQREDALAQVEEMNVGLQRMSRTQYDTLVPQIGRLAAARAMAANHAATSPEQLRNRVAPLIQNVEGQFFISALRRVRDPAFGFDPEQYQEIANDMATRYRARFGQRLHESLLDFSRSSHDRPEQALSQLVSELSEQTLTDMRGPMESYLQSLAESGTSITEIVARQVKIAQQAEERDGLMASLLDAREAGDLSHFRQAVQTWPRSEGVERHVTPFADNIAAVLHARARPETREVDASPLPGDSLIGRRFRPRTPQEWLGHLRRELQEAGMVAILERGQRIPDKRRRDDVSYALARESLHYVPWQSLQEGTLSLPDAVVRGFFTTATTPLDPIDLDNVRDFQPFTTRFFRDADDVTAFRALPPDQLLAIAKRLDLPIVRQRKPEDPSQPIRPLFGTPEAPGELDEWMAAQKFLMETR